MSKTCTVTRSTILYSKKNEATPIHLRVYVKIFEKQYLVDVV